MAADILYRLPELLSVSVGVLTAIVAVVGTLRSGALARIRVGNVEVEGADKEALARIQAEIAGARAGDPIPFEIEQLASYYSVTLGQAKISFWFSLIFASIGFMVIIGAAFLYREGDTLGASIKITSGLIIDAVAALFFVQSRRAQEAMGAFFEKLRTDRQFIEARKICEEINSETIKDHLKTILVLHYSGLQSTGMLDVLTGVEPQSHKAPASEPRKNRSAISLRSRKTEEKTNSAPLPSPSVGSETNAVPKSN
jgi:hypothetical protein